MTLLSLRGRARPLEIQKLKIFFAVETLIHLGLTFLHPTLVQPKSLMKALNNLTGVSDVHLRLHSSLIRKLLLNFTLSTQ